MHGPYLVLLIMEQVRYINLCSKSDVIGKLIVSDPFSTCTVVNNNIRDKIVLVEDVGHKKHCDYAFLVYTVLQ